MRVFENNELTIDYFADKSYFRVVRQGKMEISEDEYKSLMLKWVQEIKFYKPTYQLVSYMNYYKPITPHMQVWINENLVGPAFNAGMKKVAFIISRDFYVQVSLEQTMKEKEGQKFKIKYFDNEIDAENWLFDEE
jgi:hypothetical protein